MFCHQANPRLLLDFDADMKKHKRVNDAPMVQRLHDQLISPCLVAVLAMATCCTFVSKHPHFCCASSGQYLAPLILIHHLTLPIMFSKNLLTAIISWSPRHIHSVWCYCFFSFCLSDWKTMEVKRGKHANSLVIIHVNIFKLILVFLFWMRKYGDAYILIMSVIFYCKNKFPSINFTWFLKVIHPKISYF